MMDDLVARTRGFQPWRKVFHAVNGVTVVTVITVWELPSTLATGILVAIAVALVAVDGLRLAHRRSNELFFRLFRLLASPREARGLASSTWYALGMAIAVAAFPLEHAVSGILVLALADPLASLAGHRWGRRPFLGGTVAGTVTFLLTAGLLLGLRHPLPVALAAALLVTLAERRSWPLDDNLSIPVVSAATTTGLALLLG